MDDPEHDSLVPGRLANRPSGIHGLVDIACGSVSPRRSTPVLDLKPDYPSAD